ncbi:MAG: hypothetical protein LQ349_008535 [Xanthoria aureola]|nr:MAG: hypothetical protein LQ349_008535 [Xanthoria aureola]
MDIFTNSWSAFEDLVIWALPIPVLYKLKVPAARKVGLYTLIGISLIPVACAITRTNAFVIWIKSPDISWNFPIYPLLCVIESSVALITSSLPGIYPLFRQPAPEHRRSVVVPPVDSEKGGTWTAKVPEEEPQDLNTEERPPTQRTMKAYVSSTDEAAPAGQHFGSHRRNYSSEDAESLCYVGEAMDRVSSISASSEEHNALSAK